ncbi:COP9 signalosome complex subunit 7b [Globomyces sp. JEL0801]|nr:COP9 signalosome complex subunit 7b [Globomyces sp. JEL0801]
MTKIETFLILAKTAKGAAMVALINDVLAASDIYQFGELLDCPNVQALKDSDLHSHYMALYHFAYGNLTTYYKDPSLPKLNDIQLRKLKQLTLVALAERKDLDIPNVRQLEDIIIASIYSNIIQGKLDQKNV